MALDASHRVMPSSAFPPDDERSHGDDTANLFAPISVENRITGNTRVRRQHVQAQLTPGSNYDYGREDFVTQPKPTASLNTEEAAIGYNKSVPPTFLRRTMRDSIQPSPSTQAGAYPMPGMPMAAAYTRAAAAQAAAASEAMGGFGAPLPFQFANRMDRAEPALPDGAAFDLGAQSPMQPYGYPAPLQGEPEASAPTGGYAMTPAQVSPLQAATASGYAMPPVMGSSAQVGAAGDYAQPPTVTMPTQGSYTDGYSMPPMQAMPDPAAAGSHAMPPAQTAPATPTPAAEGEYAPRRAGRRVERLLQNKSQMEPIMELPPLPVQTIDTWAAMGWKSPESTHFENTAVWRVSDLTMFERNAFDEPLDPLRNPSLQANPFEVADPFGYDDRQTPGMPGIPVGAQTPLYPSSGMEQDAYPPYGAQANGAYGDYPGMDTQSMRPVSPDEAYGYEDTYADAREPQGAYQPSGKYPPVSATKADRHAASPKPERPAPQQPAPKKKGFDLAAMGPKRMVLFICCTLAILFCLVEVGRMVLSLMENDQEMQDNRDDFFQSAGIDPGQTANSVELLPAGQTYVPTATPVAAQTPTEAPRIAQNDPLIGVVDGGGVSTTFQAALPSPTPATRSKLTQYPENALLSISADFAARRQDNSDVVGQLTINGVLDETFVQRNNTFYLTHNARGVFGNIGAVFVDESVVLKRPPENLLLRGQTTIEGKLFQPLLQYATAGADFVKSHGIITCNTIYEQARYVIFAIIHADSATNSPEYFNYAGYPTFQSDAQMERYVESARARSVYPISVSVKATDRLLTLATLSEGSDTSNLVILCRKLRNGETEGNIQQN